MAWELIGKPDEVPEWVSWVDRDAVSRALRTMEYLAAHPLAPDASDEWRWTRTTQAFETLRAFCSACDKPPTLLGYYAAERVKLDDGGEDYEGLWDSPNVMRAEVWRLLQRHSEPVRDAVANGGDVDLRIALRVDFDWLEQVRVRRGWPPDPQGGRDRYVDDHTDRAGADAASPWWTTTWAEYEEAGASDRVNVIAYPPLKVSYDLAMTVIRTILERGAVDAVTRTFAVMIVRNMRLARLLAGPGAPDEEILRAASAVDVQALTMPRLEGGAGALLNAFKAARAVARELPGGDLAALVITVLVGIIEWPYLIFGTAVGQHTDPWLRAEPLLYKPDWHGSLLPSPEGTAPVDPPLAPPFDVVDNALPPSGFEQYFEVGSTAEERGGNLQQTGQEGTGGGGLVALGLGVGALWWLSKKKGRK